MATIRRGPLVRPSVDGPAKGLGDRLTYLEFEVALQPSNKLMALTICRYTRPESR
jgi:hypothetical protein